jgi:hypothetical protein
MFAFYRGVEYKKLNTKAADGGPSYFCENNGEIHCLIGCSEFGSVKSIEQLSSRAGDRLTPELRAEYEEHFRINTNGAATCTDRVAVRPFYNQAIGRIERHHCAPYACQLKSG